MLSMVKFKNPYAQAAKMVYAEILLQVRQPYFYQKYGVPDSFDGRFDLMLLHIFLILNRMFEDVPEEAEAFNQALFDATFEDMDQTLREMGIGDMGIPKHMRKMMKAFNGRMHAYRDASENNNFEGALVKNLYGTVENPDADIVKAMVEKVGVLSGVLQTQSSGDILNGQVVFEG